MRRTVALSLSTLLLLPLLPSGCLTAGLFEGASKACRSREVEEWVARPSRLVRAARTADGALHVQAWYERSHDEPELRHYVLRATGAPRPDLPPEEAWPAVLPRVEPGEPLPELQRVGDAWPLPAVPLLALPRTASPGSAPTGELDEPEAPAFALRLAGSELSLRLGADEWRPLGRLPRETITVWDTNYWPMVGAVLAAPIVISIDAAFIGLYLFALTGGGC